MDRGEQAGGVKVTNVFYQVWDAKGWDKVGAPDMEDVQGSAGLGDQSDVGYQGKRQIKEEPRCNDNPWLIWKPLFPMTSISQNIPENQKEGRGVAEERKLVLESSVCKAQAFTDRRAIRFLLRTYLLFLYILF